MRFVNKNVGNDLCVVPHGIFQESANLLHAAATTRGLGVEEMKRVAHCIALTARDFDGTRKEVLDTVADICEKFPLYK